MENKRTKWIDIAKGLGIIGVVWGHTGLIGKIQIICFHMAFFFFLSGYVLNVKRPLADTVKKRIKTLYVPFVFWQVLFMLIHNIIYKLPLSYSDEIYTIKDVFMRLRRVLLFDLTEFFLAPTWFLSALFGGVILTCILYKVLPKNVPVRIICGVGLWILGMALYNANIGLFWCNNLLTSNILMSVIFIILGCESRNIIKYNNLFCAIIGFSVVFVSTQWLKLRVDVRACSYSNYILYFLSAIGGIYFSMYLSQMLAKIKIGDLLAVIGKCSISIMALHYLVFGLIGYFQINYLGFGDMYRKGCWGILMLFSGVMIPTAITLLYRKIKNFFINKQKTNVDKIKC